MRHIFISIIMITIFSNFSQAQLNDYKYIIVPKRFEGFKSENQHLTSTLVKHLFSQKGFNAVYDDALPPDLFANGCLGLFVHLQDDSSMFTTKTILTLTNCEKKEVFTTLEGKSKLKDYKDAYQEAITEAFQSFNSLDYSYSGKVGTKEPISVSFKNDVKVLKDSSGIEKRSLNRPKETVVQQEATQERQTYKSSEPVDSDYKKSGEAPGKVAQQEAITEVQSIKTVEPVVSDIQKMELPQNQAKSSIDLINVLYAQEIPNGFQLVDSTPKIRLKIFKTSVPDVYTAENEQGNGVVYKKDGKWFFEHYVAEKLEVEELNIKF